MRTIKLNELNVVKNSDLETYLNMIRGIREIDDVWIDDTRYDIDFTQERGNDSLRTSFSFDILTGKLVDITINN